MQLKNKSALITGGSRGIGKAIARAFLREGANVMLAARSEDELRIANGESGKEFGGDRIAIHLADVSRENDVKKLVDETIKRFSKIDILVNGAGIYGPIGPSESVDFAKWKQTFEINVFGTFKMFQEVAPHMMKQKKGKIINFSGGGDGPLARFSAYSASKASVVRLTETLAAEIRDYNVDINAIAPGGVNTVFLDQALAAGAQATGEEKYKMLLKQKEEGGVPPEKAAELCVFLASEASDGLSGKLLSAVWDDWRNWKRSDIEDIMKGDRLNLRRVNQ
jgi:NAD(P)-dependent dehydrogenase (short-subunit alcohol dehydrogenase family)